MNPPPIYEVIGEEVMAPEAGGGTAEHGIAQIVASPNGNRIIPEKEIDPQDIVGTELHRKHGIFRSDILHLICASHTNRNFKLVHYLVSEIECTLLASTHFNWEEARDNIAFSSAEFAAITKAQCPNCAHLHYAQKSSEG